MSDTEDQEIISPKMRYRWGRKNRRELSKAPFDGNNQITIVRKNGQWMASGAKRVHTARNPEEALHGLIEKVFKGSGDISGSKDAADFLRISGQAACDILEFSQKADVDGQHRFVVDFVTHRQLSKPDFEYRITSNAIKCWQCKYNPNAPVEYQRQDDFVDL